MIEAIDGVATALRWETRGFRRALLRAWLKDVQPLLKKLSATETKRRLANRAKPPAAVHFTKEELRLAEKVRRKRGMRRR